MRIFNGFVVAACLCIGAATADGQQLEFATVATVGSGAKGLAHYAPNNSLVVAVNYSTGLPYSLAEFHDDATNTQFGVAAGFVGEIKLGSIGALGLGGFTPGDIFSGNGTSGDIVRTTAGGATVINPWINLPGGGNGQIRGSITQDTTGIFGNQLIVVTSSGQVWVVDSTGATSAAPLASLGTALEGVAVLPNDIATYGPLAGRIITGGEGTTLLHAIDASGVVTSFNTGVPLEDIDVVEANSNFVGTSFQSNTLVGVRSDQWAPYVGDIILTREFPLAGTSGLYRLFWNGASLVLSTITMAPGSPAVGQWEHVTFTTYSPVTLCPTDTDLD